MSSLIHSALHPSEYAADGSSASEQAEMRAAAQSMASASSIESEDEEEEGGDAFGMRRVRVQHGPESVAATEYACPQKSRNAVPFYPCAFDADLCCLHAG